MSTVEQTQPLISHLLETAQSLIESAPCSVDCFCRSNLFFW